MHRTCTVLTPKWVRSELSPLYSVTSTQSLWQRWRRNKPSLCKPPTDRGFVRGPQNLKTLITWPTTVFDFRYTFRRTTRLP